MAVFCGKLVVGKVDWLLPGAVPLRKLHNMDITCQFSQFIGVMAGTKFITRGPNPRLPYIFYPICAIQGAKFWSWNPTCMALIFWAQSITIPKVTAFCYLVVSDACFPSLFPETKPIWRCSWRNFVLDVHFFNLFQAHGGIRLWHRIHT